MATRIFATAGIFPHFYKNDPYKLHTIKKCVVTPKMSQYTHFIQVGLYIAISKYGVRLTHFIYYSVKLQVFPHTCKYTYSPHR